MNELKVLFDESKKSTNIELNYTNRDMNESPIKKSPSPQKLPEKSPHKLSEKSPHKSPEKRPVDTVAPPSKNVSPVKKVRVNDDQIDVTLGTSGKSYDKMKIKSKKSLFELNVLYGDLFKLPDSNNTSLAHCISRDLKMNKGVAKIFREKFGRVNELENVEIGEVGILKIDNR